MGIEDTYEGFITPEDGEITFNNHPEQDIFDQFLKNHEGETLWLSIESKTPSRTSRQNRFYWVFLEKIAQASGHTPKELHTTFKHAFLDKQQVEGIGNKKYQEAPSTKGLSKKEFSDYIKKIEMKTGISAPSRKRYGL